MATFLELQNSVMAFTGLGESDRTRIKGWINTAQYDVATHVERWVWLERASAISTTAATQTTTLTTLTRTPGRLRPNASGVFAPTFVDWNTFERNGFSHQPTATTATGMPTMYSIYAGSFVWYPIPNAVYAYLFQNWTYPVVLSGDQDTPVIPIEHHDVMVYGAAMYAAARDKDTNMVGFWQGKYNEKIRMMKADNKFNQFESPQKIPMPASYHGEYDY